MLCDDAIFVGAKFYTVQYDISRTSAVVKENIETVSEAKVVFEQMKQLMPPRYQFCSMHVNGHPIVLPRFLAEADAEIFFGAIGY